MQSALGSLYQDSGDLVKARAYYQKLLAANPKDIAATLDLGRIEIKSGNPQGIFDPLESRLQAWRCKSIIRNRKLPACTSWPWLSTGCWASPQEVLRNEQEALAIWRRIGPKAWSGLQSQRNGEGPSLAEQ